MVACRTNYFNDIRPADPLAKKQGGYLEATSIARNYFTAGKAAEFHAYLSETKYLADLWAAHLVLEYGDPDTVLAKECLELVERYAASAFDAQLAAQEQQWLHAYTATGQNA